MPNGDSGGGFDFGGLFDALLAGLINAIIAIISFLQQLVQVLVGALNFLFGGIVGTFDFSFAGLDTIWHGLKGIYDKIWKGVILAQLKHLGDLYHLLQVWAKKLKAWLDKFQALQKKYQVRAFRRVINLIQRTRKILLIFRVFHLKFATKLDNILAGIEGRLIARQLDIVRKTNEIIGFLNFIADPKKGWSRFPLFIAFGRSIDAMLKLLTGTGLDWWFSKKVPSGYSVGPPITYTQHYTALGSDLSSGGGDVGAWRSDLAQWQSRMKEVS